MTWDVERKKVGARKCHIVKPTLDYCSLVFAQGACGASDFDATWNISTAASEGTSFSFFTQDSAPVGVVWKYDGTRLWMVGASTDAIYEYDAGTAWNENTLVYNGVSLSVAGQDTSPTGIDISSDGLHIYMTGNAGDKIVRYAMGGAWSLSGGAYAEQYSVAALDTQPGGVTVSADGTKIALIGNTNDKIYQLTMATAHSLASISVDGDISIAAFQTNPTGIRYADDGRIIYITGSSPTRAHKLDLSTAYDALTFTYSTVYLALTDPSDVAISPNGKWLYILRQASYSVYRYLMPGTDIAPCYNTPATCKNIATFSNITKTYTYYENLVDFPSIEVDGLPFVDRVDFSPTRIQPGKGISSRATATITMRDAPHHDRGVDPYIDSRAYDASTQGTYWGKFIARNKYYPGRPISIYSGYLTDTFDIANFKERRYIIDKMELSKGEFKITCKDRLKKLDDAMAPAPSNMVLASGITDTATTLTVSISGANVGLPVIAQDGSSYYVPTYAGDIPIVDQSGTTYYLDVTLGAVTVIDQASTSYTITLADEAGLVGQSVRVRIGSEYIDGTFTDSVTLNSLTRGVGGSTAVAHDAGDSVQLCLYYPDGTAVTTILRDVMSYAGIVEADLDTALWDEQESKWLISIGVGGTVGEPTKVTDIVEQITSQTCSYIWDDVEAGKIKLRAIAPEEYAALTTINDDYNIIGGSIRQSQEFRDQITRLFVYYAPLNIADGNTAENMGGIYVSPDFDAESALKWDRIKAKKIIANWLTDTGSAGTLSSRTRGRYLDGETRVEFELAPKDYDLVTGDEFLLQTHEVQDETGASPTVRMQVLEVSEMRNGKYKYLAERSLFQGRRYAKIAPDTISSTYSTALDSEKEYAYICNNNGFMSDGSEGYKVI